MRFTKILLTGFILFSGNLFSQYYEGSEQSGIGIPYFDVVIQNQFDDSLKGNLVTVITQFLNDDLTFVKSDSGYEAQYEVLIAAYDDDNNVVMSRTINKKVSTDDYTLTNSRDDKISLSTVINLKPGKYTLLVKSTDLTTNKVATRKLNVTLPDYMEKQISISGISFLQHVVFDSLNNLKEYTPTIGNNFTARAGQFYIYFDLYARDIEQPVKIKYELYDKKDKIEFDTTLTKKLTSVVSPQYLKIEKSSLKQNRYRLEVKVDQGEYKVKSDQQFSFFWTDVPVTDEDIDLALEQMTYIVPHDSLKKYKKADLEDKQRFFKKFWDDRDPNPKTSKNELKDEYFKRINYANRNFSAFSLDGWLTDRGRILIKFGFPDDIERHPFEMGTRPYEIWRYYALRKTFVFQDRTGFGDYRLHPDYIDVEFQ